MNLWELVKTGGWVMFPLLLCSVVVWAVCVERFWALRRWKEKNKEFLLEFSNYWIRGEFDQAKKLCDLKEIELAEIGKELIQISTKSVDRDQVASKLDRCRLSQSAELRKFLWILGTIGSASPFIGLFGTVVGIIKSFQSMAQTGSGGFTVVAAGISEALVATAAGILVAVIALFFYNYFQVRVGDYQFQLKLLVEEIFELWESPSHNKTSV